MPLLVHPVRRALRVHRLSVEHPRLAHGEVGDVDHLLDFAVAFRLDLAVLERDERAQRILVVAQQVAEAAHRFAASGRRHVAPCVRGGRCNFDHRGEIRSTCRGDTRQRLFVGGISRDHNRAATPPLAGSQADAGIVGSDAEAIEQRAHLRLIHVVFPVSFAQASARPPLCTRC